MAIDTCFWAFFKLMEAGQLGETGARAQLLVAEVPKHVLAHAPTHQRPMVVKPALV